MILVVVVLRLAETQTDVQVILLKTSLHTLIYTQEIGNIALEPQGAALTVPKGHASLSV